MSVLLVCLLVLFLCLFVCFFAVCRLNFLQLCHVISCLGRFQFLIINLRIAKAPPFFKKQPKADAKAKVPLNLFVR